MVLSLSLCIYTKCKMHHESYNIICDYVMCFVVLVGIFIVFKVIQFYKRNFPKIKKKLCILHQPRYLYTAYSFFAAEYILKQIFQRKVYLIPRVSFLEKMFYTIQKAPPCYYQVYKLGNTTFLIVHSTKVYQT